jgi:hypothetical protein
MKRFGFLLALTWLWIAVFLLTACGGSSAVSGPSSYGGTGLPPAKPAFDMVDFMLTPEPIGFSQDGGAWGALPTYRVGTNRWIECKFGDCFHHEALRYDEEWIYLDEDHSLLAEQPWFVYTLGRWARRRWSPGDTFDVSHFSAWYQDGSCRRNIEGHEILYRIRFEELWLDYDFGGDLGVRDAVVLTYSPDRPEYASGHPPRYETPEWNVYARGAGRVYWGYDRPTQGSRFNNRRAPLASSPAQAQTCAWR